MNFNHNKPAQEQTESGSNLFVKLKDGQSVSGILAGSPYVYYKKWENGKSVPCEDGEEGASFAFRINLVVNENKALVPKILDKGWKVYAQLKALTESGYDLSKTAVSIGRTGSGKSDTVYTVLPLPPNAQPSPQMIEQIKDLKLIDLAPVKKAADGMNF
jgi:hypothetical protein